MAERPQDDWIKDDRGRVVAPPMTEFGTAAFPDVVLFRVANAAMERTQLSLDPADAREMAQQLLRAADDAERKK